MAAPSTSGSRLRSTSSKAGRLNGSTPSPSAALATAAPRALPLPFLPPLPAPPPLPNAAAAACQSSHTRCHRRSRCRSYSSVRSRRKSGRATRCEPATASAMSPSMTFPATTRRATPRAAGATPPASAMSSSSDGTSSLIAISCAITALAALSVPVPAVSVANPVACSYGTKPSARIPDVTGAAAAAAAAAAASAAAAAATPPLLPFPFLPALPAFFGLLDDVSRGGGPSNWSTRAAARTTRPPRKVHRKSGSMS
mmetsp:Transcript_24980/g.87053  ORF Transcript_24980/g.87053 Transcript_24980/m.87053 type:complete len:255 (+) Transcript_24980:570-1334(+)